MDTYLVDEAVLGEFVDSLIKEKYPDDQADAHKDTKEQAVKALNFQILKALISQLTEEQGAELGKLAEDDNTEPDAFDAFFQKCGVDLDETLKSTLENFKNEFLKGGE